MIFPVTWLPCSLLHRDAFLRLGLGLQKEFPEGQNWVMTFCHTQDFLIQYLPGMLTEVEDCFFQPQIYGIRTLRVGGGDQLFPDALKDFSAH